MPAIVIVNATEQVAPAPSTLQKTGGIISWGATTLSTGTYALLTTLGDLTGILTGPAANSSITWAPNNVPGPSETGTATVTTAAPHGQVGTFNVRIIGATPSGYNGKYSATVIDTTHFTYPVDNPGGPASVPGFFILPGTQQALNELVEMATTFFANGNNQAVYVLELGSGSVSTQVAALSTFITAQGKQFFYSYLVPRAWDANANFITLIKTFTAPTSKTYFHITTTVSNYANYIGLKCAICWIESPTVGGSEFSAAALFYDTLATDPGPAARVPPFAFRFLFGVTPYPTLGNGATLTTLANNYVNVVGTGSEGGISDEIAVNGTTMDGEDFLFWYSADWIQIQIALDIANAVINGSNNEINPLYYNQNGINTLQIVGENDLENAVTFGLATGAVRATSLDTLPFANAYANGRFADTNVINAIPFIIYTAENPGDYPLGRYAGFAVIYRPATGFKQIVFDIVVTQFITP